MTTPSTVNPEKITTANPSVGIWGRLWAWIGHSQATALLGFLIVLSIVIGLIAPRFLQVSNLGVITRQASFVALVSLGQMTALIGGALDLSVGATAGLAGICAALLMHYTNINPYLAMLMGVAVGSLVGLSNGLLITRLRLNALIATLGTAFMIQGAILVITGGWAIPDMPETIQWLGKDSLGPVPIPTVITILIAIALAFMLNRTFIGRHIFAIGGNEEAAILVGIPVKRVRTLVFVISGTLAATAGVIMVARLASGQPTIGASWLLPSFAAAILGGTAMSGGTGSVLGTLVGAVLMAVIQNGIVMIGLSVYWENVVVGAVLIVAIIFDSFRTGNLRLRFGRK